MLTANEIRSIINERLKEYNYLLQNTNFKDLNITHSISNGARKKGVVTGENSFVSGANNEASAPHTAAIGTNNVAKGNSSMAIGEGTSAYSDFQFVHGKFNELDANDQYAHIVGGGTVDAPKNIYVLDWDGNAYFSGSIHTSAMTDSEDSLINKGYFNKNMPIRFFPYVSIDDQAINVCINDLESFTLYKISPECKDKQVFFSIRTLDGNTTFLASDASINRYNVFVNECTKSYIKLNFGNLIYEIWFADYYRNVKIKKYIDDSIMGLGGIIDDEVIDTTSTWSSFKISKELNQKVDIIDFDLETNTLIFHRGEDTQELDFSIFAMRADLERLQQEVGNKLDAPLQPGIEGQLLSLDENGKPKWVTRTGDGGGSFSGTAAEVIYTTPSDPNIKTVQDALNKIFYVEPSVSFSADPAAGTYEIGTTIYNIDFSWSIDREVLSQSFDGTTLAPEVRSFRVEDEFNKNKTFTLSVYDGTKTVSRSLSYYFRHGRFWGASSIPATYDSNFIIGLSNREYATSRNKGAFNMNAGEGQYMYYCFPASWGTPTFNVGGFDGGFRLEATIDFTNTSGHTESYVIWRSENVNLGSQTIIVK